jgi:XisH protein
MTSGESWSSSSRPPAESGGSPEVPARDQYHDIVKRALEKDGWTVTHDPFRIEIGSRNVYVDLAAERMLAAERGDE